MPNANPIVPIQRTGVMLKIVKFSRIFRALWGFSYRHLGSHGYFFSLSFSDTVTDTCPLLPLQILFLAMVQLIPILGTTDTNSWCGYGFISACGVAKLWVILCVFVDSVVGLLFVDACKFNWFCKRELFYLLELDRNLPVGINSMSAFTLFLIFNVFPGAEHFLCTAWGTICEEQKLSKLISLNPIAYREELTQV